MWLLIQSLESAATLQNTLSVDLTESATSTETGNGVVSETKDD
jgi:hypothetical protein